MKKWSMITLAALCLALPSAGRAQALEELFDSVGGGLAQGMESGLQLAAQSMSEELTLAMGADPVRLEAGRTAVLEIEAGNPRAQETPVHIDIRLPERLAAQEALSFDAVLPAALYDEETGALAPSVTTFTREIAVVSGAESECVTAECEMSMGTRFYRARAQVEICMPDISVSAQAMGLDGGRLQPGDAFVYQIEISNAGAAPEELAVEMILPSGMMVGNPAPEGFAAGGGRVAGQVLAPAAADGEPSVVRLDVPVTIDEALLDRDADAQAVLGGVLRVGGERAALPRVQVVAPMISARLIPGGDSLAQGETMDMEVLVVNAGLAAADVRLSCLLPQGLTLVPPEADAQDEEEREAAAAAASGGDDGGADGAAEPVEAAFTPEIGQAGDDGAVVLNLHMDAAEDTGEGVSAATRRLTLRVRADEDMEDAGERLVGAALSYSADGGEAQLGEAVALRVYRKAFLGLEAAEWNAIFWATLLMAATVSCLYAAIRTEKKEEYVFD
ncbi:MAG: hypothetical protein J6K32_05720 [Clostridia bacterium]|nr:hypothetical protein [Clostridia bacterium]